MDAAKELSAINAQYPFEPLKWLPETLRLTFAEGIQMLTDAGYEVHAKTLHTACHILQASTALAVPLTLPVKLCKE